ncbi:MAG TPA: hypothetical protein VJ242_03005 [Patescibacteria group bacterium]|nr:hypothetical protein [Patescibacteria group bacterium]
MLRPENGKGVIDFQASIREAFHREALPYRGAADRIDEVADQIFDYAQNRPKFLGINIKTRAYNADIEACRINTYGLGIEGIESLGPALIALSLAKKLNLRDHQEHLLKDSAQIWKETFTGDGKGPTILDVLGFTSVLVAENDPVIQQTTVDFFRQVYSRHLDKSDNHRQLIEAIIEEGYLEWVLNKEDASTERELVMSLLAPIKK